MLTLRGQPRALPVRRRAQPGRRRGDARSSARPRRRRAPFTSKRRAIDVSGDGTNNSGRDAGAARDDAIAKGVTLNGLVILSETPLVWNPEHTNPAGGLAEYYRRNVIGGPNAFVMVAENFSSFGAALVKKLVAEIAEAASPTTVRGRIARP